MAVIRQDIIQYLLDRPHQLVRKSEIMAHGGWNSTQVTHAILSVQRSGALGDEIVTVVRGNAWRYTPRHEVTTSVTPIEPAPNLELPVTTLIRQFMINHAHETVTVEQLTAYTGRHPNQVKVGVNNMRNIAANADVTNYLRVVVHGQMWRFSPPSDWRPGLGVNYPRGQGRRSTVTSVTVSSPSSTDVLSVDTYESSDGRVFEEVGLLRDGRVVIRDQDDNMYAAQLTLIQGA